MNLSAKKISLVLAVAGLLAGVAVLYFFPPGQTWFYPRCVFHQVTGLDCPGCGGLRATHQLLHGHFRAAFALNPLLVVILPMLGWFAVAGAVKVATGRELSHPFRHPAWVWGLLALVVVFAIVRNLPASQLAGVTAP